MKPFDLNCQFHSFGFDSLQSSICDLSEFVILSCLTLHKFYSNIFEEDRLLQTLSLQVPHKQKAVSYSRVAEQKAVAFQNKMKSYKMLSSDEDDIIHEAVTSNRKSKISYFSD